jgi:4,5-DOPA dioxygenase extradiol
MMPVLFVGHGSPMNAIENNEFSKTWETLVNDIPKPSAILCISAHWESKDTLISGNAKPETIHDFYGFPEKLFQKTYPALGAPDIANEIFELLNNEKKFAVRIDPKRGLDHGTWSVLCRMYPKADIPVLQLSLNYSQNPEYHFNLGKQLSELRNRKILVIGSGNVVHNLGMVDWNGKNYDWAIKFDQKLKELIKTKDHMKLIQYQSLSNAELAIPTNEHYLPLLYVMGMRNQEDKLRFFNEKVIMGSISMTGLILTNQ